MGTAKIGSTIMCELPKDTCWLVSVTMDNAEGGTSVDVPKKEPCWIVETSSSRSGDDACWRVYGTDGCNQSRDPHFDKDIDLKKHGIFKAFAIHITNGFIYMAVEMRKPDDHATETYIDEWASAVDIYDTDENGKKRYVYKPTYKATEIVGVYDVFGGLNYEVGTDEYGYKYIIRDKYDINFNVAYKMDMGLRIVKGLFSTAWDSQGHYMDYIESSVSLNDELVGDNCILMGKEELTFHPTIVFTAKNGKSYKVTDGVDGINIEALATEKLNYMLTPNIAMKHESSSYFKIDENFGVGKMFSNAETKQIDKNGYNKIVGIMQNNNDRTIGFTERNGIDEEKWNYDNVILNTMYLFNYNPPPTKFAGHGDTGNVVGGTDIYDGSGFFSNKIPVIPITPLDESGDTVTGLRCGRTGCYTIGGVDMSTFYGMFSGGGRCDYRYTPNIKRDSVPSEKHMRMVGDSLLQEKNFFIVYDIKGEESEPSTYELVTYFFIEEEYYSSELYLAIVSYSSPTISDFCVWNNLVIIADGTSILKCSSVLYTPL